LAAWDHSLHHTSSASGLRHTAHGFTSTPPYTLAPGQPPPGISYPPASPHRYKRTPAGTGISTRHPSTTPDGLALGPDSPRADKPAPGTLSQSAEEILTPHSLLMPAFSLAQTPRRLTPPLQHPHDAPLPTTHPQRARSATASVVRLAPLHCRRGIT